MEILNKNKRVYLLYHIKIKKKIKKIKRSGNRRKKISLSIRGNVII
jgi:hypothetical protein